MSSLKASIKANNSKGTLVKAVIQYQRALAYYADESNWAVSEERIEWVANDDPLEVAEVVLGRRKSRPETGQKKESQDGRKSSSTEDGGE